MWVRGLCLLILKTFYRNLNLTIKIEEYSLKLNKFYQNSIKILKKMQHLKKKRVFFYRYFEFFIQNKGFSTKNKGIFFEIVENPLFLLKFLYEKFDNSIKNLKMFMKKTLFFIIFLKCSNFFFRILIKFV